VRGKEQMSKEKMILLLEAELEKPIEEMDSELIQHILETLEPTPSLEQQYASWEKIKSLIHGDNRIFLQRLMLVIQRDINTSAFGEKIQQGNATGFQESSNKILT
jgi:hypothetical protein